MNIIGFYGDYCWSEWFRLKRRTAEPS